MEHVESGLVGGKPGAHLFHTAERTNGYSAVGLAAPGTPPTFQAKERLGGFLDEGFHSVLIRKPVPARDSVVRVLVEAVVRTDRSRRPPFRRDGVASHRVHLRDHGNAKPAIS